MRPILVITSVVAAFVLVTSFSFSNKMESLWKKYDDYSKKDLPKEKAEILDRIIAEATQRRLPYDFYKAVTSAHDDRINVNWKEREAADSILKAQVSAFDYPIVTYGWMSEYLGASAEEKLSFIKEKRSLMESVRNDAFYKDSEFKAVVGFANDYEYALWDTCNWSDSGFADLKDNWKGKYPGEGYLEYLEACRASDKKGALTALVGKYQDKAIGLFPEAELLLMEFRSLDEDKSADVPKYKDLLSRCNAFEKRRKALRGKEKSITSYLTNVRDLIKELNSSDVSCSFEGDSITVRMRNCEEVTVLMYNDADGRLVGKPIHTFKFVSDGDHFYVWDKKTDMIPEISDGTYSIRYNSNRQKKWREYSYERYSLSIAYRHDSDGHKVYVTDAKTGEPLEAAAIAVYGSDRKMLSQENLAFYGFTKMGAPIQRLIDNLKRDYVYLEAGYNDAKGLKKSSGRLYVGKEYDRWITYADDNVKCQVLKSKPFYKPGETLDYKLILFLGGKDAHVLTDEKIKVSLLDPERRKVDESDLVTDEFGAVLGKFIIPTGRRNGQYCLTVSQNGRELCSEYFNVDEYELPSFVIDFDENHKLWNEGDTVKLTGRVSSYSGHSLAGASVRAVLYETRYVGTSHPVECSLNDDGTFALSFVARYGYFTVSLIITDITGETVSKEYHISIPRWKYVSVSVSNKVDGWFDKSGSCKIIREDVAKVTFILDGHFEDVPIDYILKDSEGKELTKGTALSGREFNLDLSPFKGDLFNIESGRASMAILRLKHDAKYLDAPVSGLFVNGESEVSRGGDITLMLGSGTGPVWAVATLYGYEGKVLRMQMVHMEGCRGKEGSLVEVKMPYMDSYPDHVVMQVFYFKDNTSYSHNQTYSRKKEKEDLFVDFSSFVDRTLPAGKCKFSLKTKSGVDVAVSVYEKAMDGISSSLSGFEWPIHLSEILPECSYIKTCEGSSFGGEAVYEEVASLGFEMSNKRGLRMSATRASGVQEESYVSAGQDVVSFSIPDKNQAIPDGAEFAIRSDFADALCFLPSLRPDADGKVSFEFNASDKLSTFVVRAFAHDKKVRSAVASRDMVVSIPVKVSMLEPRFLYVGDMCNIVVNVSADSESSASGDLYLYVYPGEDYENLKPVAVHKKHLDIKAGNAASASFPFKASEVGEIGLKAVFVGDNYSDGMFVSVPVTEPVQNLTESHSKVILPGMDQKVAEKELRSRFVNVSGKNAEVSVVSILDMLTEAMPEEFDPKGDDVISLTSAYMVRKLSTKIVSPKDAGDEALLEKIMACRNADGGFFWFAGMRSSEAITSRVLERFARLRDRGISIPDMTESVRYLDKAHFDGDIPYWRGRLMDASYMYVRSMYPEIEFVKPVGKSEKGRFDDFRKFAKHHLSSDAIGDYAARGDIFHKVVRLSTLYNLSSSDAGLDLAKAWGAGLFASYKVSKSLEGEVKSVLEYAVKHDSGGIYYPNAVMPFRGMLEDEAYMHAMICTLLSKTAPESEVADGIRIWLMLQKETQEWKASPAFVETLVTVLDGSESVLSTKVMALSANYSKPFSEIKSAGNGYKISKTYLKVGADGKPVELKGGESLAAGDKIIARYNIWSAENRSFVKLTAPREAAFSPVSQFSGYYRGGYREVRSDCTNYYFDSYPEEKTTIEEEFHVTRRGVFSAPVVSIESFYAPHYRANDKFFGKIVAD